MVKDYSSRLTWISERDRGQSHAINKGFRMARGEILAWLNSDDLFLPGAVSAAVAGFNEHPGVGAVYGEGYLIDRAGKVTGRFPCTETFNLWKLAFLSDYILQQTVHFRKSAIEEAGYVREQLHYAMDWDLLIRIGKKYPLACLPHYMACLREYPEAKSFAGGARRIREIRSVLNEHTGLRFPPGYIVYGLDTYTQIWCAGIDRRAPSSVADLLKRLVRTATGRIIGRTIHHSQGWYGDGWAGPRLRLMLPASSRRLILEGSLPPNPKLAPQRLRLLANGTAIAEKEILPGDFVLEFDLPKQCQEAPPLLEVRASRFFKPGSHDPRRLAYILKRAE